MPRNHKTSSSNGHSNTATRKSKDKPTYKIIVLGSGGVGKVRFHFVLYISDKKNKIKIQYFEIIEEWLTSSF